MDNMENEFGFVKVAKSESFTGKRLASFGLLGRRVAVTRGPDGELIAFEAGCKHQGADLAAGPFDGRVLTCPRHGWRYDIMTGACLDHDVPTLRRHACKEQEGWIWVSTTPLPRHSDG